MKLCCDTLILLRVAVMRCYSEEGCCTGALLFWRGTVCAGETQRSEREEGWCGLDRERSAVHRHRRTGHQVGTHTDGLRALRKNDLCPRTHGPSSICFHSFPSTGFSYDILTNQTLHKQQKKTQICVNGEFHFLPHICLDQSSCMRRGSIMSLANGKHDLGQPW